MLAAHMAGALLTPNVHGVLAAHMAVAATTVVVPMPIARITALVVRMAVVVIALAVLTLTAHAVVAETVVAAMVGGVTAGIAGRLPMGSGMAPGNVSLSLAQGAAVRIASPSPANAGPTLAPNVLVLTVLVQGIPARSALGLGARGPIGLGRNALGLIVLGQSVPGRLGMLIPRLQRA